LPQGPQARKREEAFLPGNLAKTTLEAR